MGNAQLNLAVFVPQLSASETCIADIATQRDICVLLSVRSETRLSHPFVESVSDLKFLHTTE